MDFKELRGQIIRTRTDDDCMGCNPYNPRPLNDLPVGSYFYVKNGHWHGTIIEKDGQRCILAEETGNIVSLKKDSGLDWVLCGYVKDTEAEMQQCDLNKLQNKINQSEMKLMKAVSELFGLYATQEKVCMKRGIEYKAPWTCGIIKLISEHFSLDNNPELTGHDGKAGAEIQDVCENTDDRFSDRDER